MVDELIEKELRVDRTAAGLGMELHRTPWPGRVADALVRSVVHVGEPGRPVGGERVGVDGISVVLACDEATHVAFQTCRLVVAAVAVFQLVDVGTGGFA